MGEAARIAANPCRITRCRMLARIVIIFIIFIIIIIIIIAAIVIAIIISPLSLPSRVLSPSHSVTISFIPFPSRACSHSTAFHLRLPGLLFRY